MGSDESKLAKGAEPNKSDPTKSKFDEEALTNAIMQCIQDGDTPTEDLAARVKQLEQELAVSRDREKTQEEIEASLKKVLGIEKLAYNVPPPNIQSTGLPISQGQPSFPFPNPSMAPQGFTPNPPSMQTSWTAPFPPPPGVPTQPPRIDNLQGQPHGVAMQGNFPSGVAMQGFPPGAAMQGSFHTGPMQPPRIDNMQGQPHGVAMQGTFPLGVPMHGSFHAGPMQPPRIDNMQGQPLMMKSMHSPNDRPCPTRGFVKLQQSQPNNFNHGKPNRNFNNIRNKPPSENSGRQANSFLTEENNSNDLNEQKKRSSFKKQDVNLFPPRRMQCQNDNQPRKQQGQNDNQPRKQQGQNDNQPRKQQGQNDNQPRKQQGQNDNQPRKPQGQNDNQPRKPQGQNDNQPRKPQGQSDNQQGRQQGHNFQAKTQQSDHQQKPNKLKGQVDNQPSNQLGNRQAGKPTEQNQGAIPKTKQNQKSKQTKEGEVKSVNNYKQHNQSQGPNLFNKHTNQQQSGSSAERKTGKPVVNLQQLASMYEDIENDAAKRRILASLKLKIEQLAISNQSKVKNNATSGLTAGKKESKKNNKPTQQGNFKKKASNKKKIMDSSEDSDVDLTSWTRIYQNPGSEESNSSSRNKTPSDANSGTEKTKRNRNRRARRTGREPKENEDPPSAELIDFS